MSVLVFPQRKNLARTTLAANMNDSQGSVVVANLADLKITDGNNFVWAALVRAASYGTLTEPDNTEFVKITDVVSGTSTVSFDRGESDSTPITFSTGDYIEIRDPKDVIDYIQTVLDETHTTADTALADSATAITASGTALTTANAAKATADANALAISDGNTTLNIENAVLNKSGSSAMDLMNTIGLIADTGLAKGGILTTGAGAVQFSISDGFGFILDPHTDAAAPVFTRVSWTGKTNITVDTPAALLSFIYIDIAGDVQQQLGFFTCEQQRTVIVLGTVGTADGVNVTSASQNSNSIINPNANFIDFSDTIGTVNSTGNTFSPAASDLTLAKAVGRLYLRGINLANNSKDPNNITSGSIAVADLIRILDDGSGNVTIENLSTTVVDTDNYDNNGVLTALPNNKWQNLRVYFFASPPSVLVQYGQTVFNNQAEAIAQVDSEPFTILSPLNGGAIRTTISVKKGTTDLSNTANATFTHTGKLGFGIGNSSAGGPGAQDFQATYNLSDQPQITTDATKLALQIRQGSGSDTDMVFETLNGAGTVTYSVDGNGDVNMTDLFAEDGTFTGDIGAVGGTFTGNVLINSATANLAVGNGLGDADIVIDGAVGNNRVVSHRTGGLARFDSGISNVAEGGSNAGSDYFINSFNDAGGFLFQPLSINRASGDISLNGNILCGKSIELSESADTKRIKFIDPGNDRSWHLRQRGDSAGDFNIQRGTAAGSFLANSVTINAATDKVTLAGDLTCVDLIADDGTFTGDVAITGNLQFPTNGTGIDHTLTGLNNANLDIDFANDAANNSILRIFRATTTSTGGNKRLVIYNGSATEMVRLDGVTGEGIFAGNISAVEGTFSGEVSIVGTNPTFGFNETDAATDEKIWKWRVNGGVMFLSSFTDAGALSTNLISINRVGVATNDINLHGNTDVEGTLEVTGDISGADIFATDGDFSGVINVGNATPVLTPSTQANTIVAANASHSGITVSTNTPAATTNIFFQDSVSGVLGRITAHGSSHANANQMWIYSNGVAALKLAANQDITMSADLAVLGGAVDIGVVDSVQGVLNIHGPATGEGAQINMKGGGGGTAQDWVVDVTSSAYRVFSNQLADSEFQIFNAHATGVTNLSLIDGDINISLGDLNVTVGDIALGGDMTIVGGLLVAKQTRYSAQVAITTAWDIETNPSVKQTMSANRTVTISNQAVNSNGVFTVTFGGTLFTLGFAATGGSVTFHGSGSPTYAINTIYVISVYFYNATDCYISVIGENL